MTLVEMGAYRRRINSCVAAGTTFHQIQGLLLWIAMAERSWISTVSMIDHGVAVEWAVRSSALSPDPSAAARACGLMGGTLWWQGSFI